MMYGTRRTEPLMMWGSAMPHESARYDVLHFTAQPGLLAESNSRRRFRAELDSPDESLWRTLWSELG